MNRHIIVQADKKNLRGKYIERVGFWMPRSTQSYKRGCVLNRHKLRYWLSVGAEPTAGVIRVLNKYDMYPRKPVPWGKASLYEKPLKQYHLQAWKDYFKGKKNPEWHYPQMLQEQINIVERQKRIQAEALDNLGEGKFADLDVAKTDDIESEEADVFERAIKFEELSKRFEKHRKEQWKLKGNDLRYNIYLKKMQKLVRMDLGLDVEGYKDYVHNLKVFAQYNKDWEILSEDNMKSVAGTSHGPLSTNRAGENTGQVGQESLDDMRIAAKNADKLKQMRNTVGKLFREYHSRIRQRDLDIVVQFEQDPLIFLEQSIDLQVDLKRLYDKRKIQVEERNQMNTFHIANVTDKDLERCGVSQRDFDLIKKMMILDNQIFASKEFKEASPFTYTVDLSKYENIKIPKDCKEILFRPQKMRKLYEKYWQIASELDSEDASDKMFQKHKRWKRQHPRLIKGDEEFVLMDRIVAAIDRAVEDQRRYLKEESEKIDWESVNKTLQKEAKKNAKSLPTVFFRDAFEQNASKIMDQVKDKGFCTKSQMEYLILYNQVFEIEKRYHFPDLIAEETSFLVDKSETKDQIRSTDGALKKVTLPKEIQSKFEKVKDENLDFKAKSELLGWFVDSMRISVLNYLEEAQIFATIGEREKEAIIDEIVSIQSRSKNELFNMHKGQKEGKLVLSNEYYKTLQDDIDKFAAKLDIVEIEFKRQQIIQKHNAKLDVFSKQIDERKASLAEASLVLNDGEPEDGYSSFEADQNPILWEARQEYKRAINKYLIKDDDLSNYHDEITNDDINGQEQEESNENGNLTERNDGVKRTQIKKQVAQLQEAEREYQEFKQSMKRKQGEDTPFEELIDSEQYKNVEMLDQEQVMSLIQRLNDAYWEVAPHNQQELTNEATEQKLKEQIYTASRHGLDFSKLYHNRDGGYDIEILKKVLQRIKSDAQDGIHPFVDGEKAHELDKKLERVLKLRIEKGKQGQDQTIENAGQDEEDEQNQLSPEQEILAGIQDEEEREMTKELFKLVQEKRQKQLKQDANGELNCENFETDITNEEFEQLKQMYKNETGYHLYDIEDDDEFMEAWFEWVQDKFLKRSKSKKKSPDIEQQIEDRLIAQHPELGPILDQIRGPAHAKSLIDNQWWPTTKEYNKEMDRLDSNVGRYPVGFRHYENWQNYTYKFPDATLADYRDDMNSQISFEEFLLLKQKSFLYECQFNPMVIYKFKLNQLDPNDETDKQYLPEVLIESSRFKDDCGNVYAEMVQKQLINKSWFKKVDALEMLTNYWSYGRGLHAMPKHNIYVPVQNNIMPRPKFRDYDKEDQEGKDFTYRTKESVAPNFFKDKLTDTLKPHPFSPKLQYDENEQSKYNHVVVSPPYKKYKRIRRLSRDKRSIHKSNYGQFPSKWQFSSISKGQVSETDELQEIHKFDQQIKLTEGLSMSSQFDNSPYSLWNLYAQHIFGSKK